MQAVSTAAGGGFVRDPAGAASCTSLPPAARGAAGPGYGGANGRKQALLPVWQDIQAMAVTSDVACTYVLDTMRLLKTSTAELTDRRAQSCSSGPEIGSTSLPHFAQLPVSVQRALTAEMGLTWKLAPANPPCLSGDALEFGSAAGENLVGRSIICNWPNNVGWSVGKVLNTFTDTAGLQQTVGQTLMQPNFRVSYKDDGSDTWSQVLDKGNCLNIITSGGRVPNKIVPYDWLLLEARELHNVPAVGSALKRPATMAKRGRPTKEARRAPIHGPTSRQGKGAPASKDKAAASGGHGGQGAAIARGTKEGIHEETLATWRELDTLLNRSTRCVDVVHQSL